MRRNKDKIIGTIIVAHNYAMNISYDITKVETDNKGNTFYTTTTPYKDGFLILDKSAITSELRPV